MLNHTSLSSEAIQAALNGEWKNAIKFNLKIIQAEKGNIDALCRLARAYAENGQILEAKRTYRKIMKLDRFNSIAKRCMEKLRTASTPISGNQPKPIRGNLFLEESGKTKTVSLVRLGSPDVLLSLSAACEVQLDVKNRFISVKDEKNRYLGRLPDDLCHRLIKLIKNGNRYLSVVKYCDKKSVQIFIKETHQGARNAGLPSFPPSADLYHSFLPPDVIDDTPVEIVNEED